MIAPHHTSASWTRFLQAVFFSGVILYVGKTLFIPLSFGLLIAIVMYPVCKWLEQKRWPKALAITASLSIVILLFILLLLLLVWQVMVFWQDWPQISVKLATVLTDMQNRMAAQLGITLDVQAAWLRNMMMNTSGIAGKILSGTFNTAASTLFMLFMIPVFAALFLYHRRIFVSYLRLVTPAAYRDQLNIILKEVVRTYFNYIRSMVLVYLIVGILNSIGLLALGIRHAILFGMLTAIMTIIPYIGIVASALLPISVAWITKGSIWYPVGIVGIFAFVQYLEANVIFPRVVGTHLNVSTWATLLAVLAGGILWGVSGMVLFIPFVAILKIISDHVEDWKGVNILLSRAA